MNLERIHKIVQMIRLKGAVSMGKLVDVLQVSEPTIKRDLEFLRSRLDCPLEYDRGKRGYVIRDDPSLGEKPFELPGMWFSASEIHALLTMQHLLKDLQPRMLDSHIRPLQDRLIKLLGQSHHPATEIMKRVKVIHFGTRQIEVNHFEQIAHALLSRKRLRIRYRVRDRQEDSERVVSPLQLVHYRENWLLDAWCHERKALRSFSLDAIQAVEALEESTKEVSAATLKKHFEAGYGIFSGEATHQAKLKFTKVRAQWVALETWHQDQESSYTEDGSYLLNVPYSNDQELIMDLMRHGAEVEVLAPDELRYKLAQAHLAAAEKNHPKKSR